MAAPLSQEEIDALLSSADNLDSDQGDEDSFDTSASEAPSKGGKKHVGLNKTIPFRFDFKYNSPVVKNKMYEYNPENSSEQVEISDNTVVVRTIFEYRKFLKDQKAN